MSEREKKDTPASAFFMIAVGVGMYASFGFLDSVGSPWRWFVIVGGPFFIWNGIVTLLRSGGGWIAWGVIAILTAGLGSIALSAMAVVLHYSQKEGMESDAQSGSTSPAASPSAVDRPQWPAAPPVAAPTVAPDHAAAAGLRICNQSSERGMLALGYRQGETWVSDGWRPLERGACLTVAMRIAGNRYYYYAMGERGGVWGGDYALCIDPQSAFHIEGAGDCEARGYRSRGFGMLEFAADAHDYSLALTGGKPDPLDELEEDDGVYVQGWLSDEMAIVMRVDKANRRVKVRRSEDLTTTWVEADRIITREQAQMNEIGRGAIMLTAGFCLFFPDKCRDQNQQTSQ